MKSEKLNSIGVRIIDIELLDYHLDGSPQNTFETPVFNFEINIEHRFKTKDNFIFVVCGLTILSEDKSNILGSVKASCAFEVEEMEQYYDKKLLAFKFPDPFIITLNSITISTIRGIMFGLFRGTHLHNAILPILDPKSFTLSKALD